MGRRRSNHTRNRTAPLIRVIWRFLRGWKLACPGQMLLWDGIDDWLLDRKNRSFAARFERLSDRQPSEPHDLKGQDDAHAGWGADSRILQMLPEHTEAGSNESRRQQHLQADTYKTMPKNRPGAQYCNCKVKWTYPTSRKEAEAAA